MQKDKTLVIMVGLPQSGKSTYTLKISKERGWPIVNPDSIRLSLYNQPFISEAEPWVWLIAKTMVKTLFKTGYEYVILDATNTTKKRRDEWKSDEWSIIFYKMNVDKKTCIERCIKNEKEYLIPIIERMDSLFDPLSFDDDTMIIN